MPGMGLPAGSLRVRPISISPTIWSSHVPVILAGSSETGSLVLPYSRQTEPCGQGARRAVCGPRAHGPAGRAQAKRPRGGFGTGLTVLRVDGVAQAVADEVEGHQG